MKFTSEQLANAMGLKVGDRIDIKDLKDKHHICKLKADYMLCDNNGDFVDLKYIVNHEIEILPPIKKKVGDLICKDTICRDCPLCIIHCANMTNESLYDNFEYTFEDIDDKEIYDILKARLDKEIN